MRTSTSGLPESRTQRLKQRVLTGGPATTFTQSSADSDQPQKGSSTYPPGSQPPLHLSRNLDRLGTLSHKLPCLQVYFAVFREWLPELFVLGVSCITVALAQACDP